MAQTRLAVTKWGVSAVALTSALGLVAPAFAQVEEITVSATRRVGTTVQDVPIAISAYSAENIENSGIQDLRDLSQLSPSYTFSTGQSNTTGATTAIRGLGTGGDNPGFESAVGVFVDGVYRSRTGTAMADFPSLERVEILRGPQGTLFGRNTSAGAISILTAGPEAEFRAFGSASYGNYQNVEVNGGLTGPLADALAMRLEGGIRQRDGYIDDVNTGRDLNNRDRWFARGQASWDINENANLRLIIDAAQTDEECCVALTLVEGATSPVVRGLAAASGLQGLVPAPVNPENYKVAISPNRDFSEESDDFGISGELNWQIPWGRLTSITAYRDFEATRSQDIEFSGIDRAYRDGYKSSFETFTQELRLQGQAGMLDWLVGGFFLDEKSTVTDTIRLGVHGAAYVDFLVTGLTATAIGTPYQIHGTVTNASLVNPLLPAIKPASILALANGALAPVYLTPPAPGNGLNNDEFETDTQSWALFTHNQLSLSDDLTLTLGLRYNHEEKEVSGTLNSVYPSCDQLNTPGIIQSAAQGLAAANPTAALALLLACNPAINTQANGTYADDKSEEEITGIANLAYDITPDLMVYGTYSRGYKSGGYNMERQSFSYSTLSPLLPAPAISQLSFKPEFVDAYELGAKIGLGSLGTMNVAAFLQEIQDLQDNAFSGFGFVTFNSEKSISRGVEVETVLSPIDNLTLTGGITFLEAFYDVDVRAPLTGELLLARGTPFARAPKWTLASSAAYRYPLANSDLEALFYLDVLWRSDQRTQVLNRDPRSDQDAFAVFNGRIGLGPQNGNWSVELWGRNLFDQFAAIQGFNIPEQTGTVALYPQEPRTYGVTLKVSY